MSAGFVDKRRRLIALIAVGAVVLQTFVAGLAYVPAGGAAAVALGVICHGAPGAGPGAPAPAPDGERSAHLCCLLCTGPQPAALMPPSLPAWLEPPQMAVAQPPSQPCVVIARSLVRAGRSQAPPSLV
jgi:hypothetical protein